MSKFKVGDRVRRVRDEHMGMRSGDEAIVKRVTAYNHVELNEFRGQHWNDLLELANPSPIRAVTRREIVPGTYGSVVVDRNTTTDSPAPFVRFYAQAGASELREAARIFSDIADVLDEQKEAG